MGFVERAKREGLEMEITAVTILEVDVGMVGEMAERMGGLGLESESTYHASDKKPLL